MRKARFAALGIVALALLQSLAAPARDAAAEDIVLDARQAADAFEGIGALSAGASSRLLIDYPEPQRGEILDFLFKPKFGASLQHLKVEIGGDVNSTCGTEPSLARTRDEFTRPRPEYFNRGYEWWLMKEAKKRNPRIIFDILQWGAPGWIGEGKFYSQDNADFIAAFIRGAKKYHDLDIGYCGCWNEKPYDVPWLKLLRKTLNRSGLEGVKIVAADEINRWTIADKMAGDAELRDAVQVIGTHYPHFESPPAARSLGKPLWASEEGPWSGQWGAARRHCFGLAQAYSRNYIVGKMTKSIVWSPVTSYYDILPLPGSGLMKANEPWSGYYEVQPAIWITAHTTQFIEPGWKYLGGGACALLPGGGSRVAALSPGGRDFSVVVETMDAKQPQRLSFRLAGGLSASRLHAWRSTAAEQFVKLDDFPVRDGAFAIDVEPEAIYSLTTTDGQQKGAATIPKSGPMPLPYKDDFESYPAGATPRWVSDVYGAFEVAAKQGGGQCLKQIITRRGISWRADTDPATIAGDSKWDDYTVSCDVRLDFKQYACIYGRIRSAPRKGVPVAGYALRVDGDGTWKLIANNTGAELLTGKTAGAADTWHRFGLRMVGDRLTVLIDGKEAGSVTNGTFLAGMVGLGSGYEEVCFDNFLVESGAAAGGASASEGKAVKASSQ